MNGSQIFRRNRALGYVSNDIPAATRYAPKRKDNLVVTCIGRSFQVYTTNHFRLLFVSAIHPDDVTCLSIDKQYIYAASDKCIYAWRGGRHCKHILKGHAKNVNLLLPFRDHLVAVDYSNNLRVWNVKNESIYVDIPFDINEFRITALAHPPTYLNKILLGSEQGKLQLWNIKDHKLVYTFQGKQSRINTLEPAPAIDVIGIGYNDGSVVLHNLKYDETVMEFKQDWGPVTGLTFRTDGQPYMISSSTNGNVVFWDLEERKVISQVTAHTSTVTTTQCLPTEPLLLTLSPDNSMKLWIFDMPDGGARLLRIREGHSAPPLCIRYHGSNGEHILSSGEDSTLRIFNTLSETLNKSMGRASYNRKASKKRNKFLEDSLLMPPITHFTCETTRQKEWDSIAAIHAGLIQTTTWSFDKRKMGDLKLVPEKFQNKQRKDFRSEATCLALTHCGNFVIIGYSSGDVERFNIQSGIHRASYGRPAHTAVVRGVACDNLNQMVLSGCTEGYVKFWNFKEKVLKPIAKINMHGGIQLFRSHAESAMLCVALDNFSIYVVDFDTKTVVRKFRGHQAQITDATFSPDSRWLVTAAMDSTIKVWDIPSSYMIDHFQVERPCTSLSMSPTGDFLATAHVNCLGIYLWANKTLFSQVTLRSIDPFSEAPFIDLPSHTQTDLDIVEETLEKTPLGQEGEIIELQYDTPLQIDSQLITMSTLAASRWQNLLDLDIVKKRNKPKEPLKAPKQVPFFLPTVAGLDVKFDLSNEIVKDEISKIIVPENFVNLSPMGKLLNSIYEKNDYQNCIKYMKKLGPSMIDYEIKSLHPIAGGNYKIMGNFIQMILEMMRSNLDFELAQAYLATFLKVHGRSLAEKKELLELLKEAESGQSKSWQNLEEKLLYCIGVVGGLRNYVQQV